MKKYILFSISLLVIVGCSSNKIKYAIKTFPINGSLVAKTIKTDCNLLKAEIIVTTDKHLIIFDDQKNDMFKIFELPSIHYQFSWGTTGKGPDEINYVDPKTIRVFNNRLVFQDGLKIKTAIVNNDSFKIIKTKLLKPQPELINGLVMINDSIFIIDKFSKSIFEHTYKNINDDNISKDFGEYNDELNNSNFSDRYKAYRKMKAVKPDGEKFVVFYFFFNKFKLYNKNLKLLKEVIINNKNLNKSYSFKNHGIENIIYNAAPFATDKYIFVLNPNSSIKSIDNDLDTFKPQLSVWDWEGNPIAKYELNKPIFSFTVSEKFSKIYATSSFTVNEIYEYELPKVLRTE